MRYVIALSLALALGACSKSEEQPAASSPPPEPGKKIQPAPSTTPAPAPKPSVGAPKPAPATPATGAEVTQSPSALEAAYISNPDFNARVETIYKLADVGSPESIGSLGRLFHMEKDSDLKTEILDSLFDIEGQDDSKVALLAAGASTDQPKEVRESAIDALEDVKPALAIPILKALVGDPDPEISEAAKAALETVQDEQANPAQPN